MLVGLLAATLTRLARLEWWWVAFQFAFAPLLLAMLALDWSPWIYLALFAGLALIYGSAFRTRVPLYLSNAETWQALESLLPPAQPGRTPRFIDLGSGLAGPLLHLATRRPDVRFTGVELAALPAFVSRVRVALSGRDNVQACWGSFWKRDLGEFDVVFAFLSPVPMPELWLKARREMRAGSIFVSCAFEVPGVAPDQVIELRSPRQPRLLLWRMR